MGGSNNRATAYAVALAAVAVLGWSRMGVAGPADAWSRCYFGAQFGASQSKADWRYTNSSPYSSTGNADPQQIFDRSFSQSRGIVGGQAGCGRAISDSFIVGLEASFITNPMNKDADNRFIPFPQDPNFNYRQVINTNIQSVYSVTGRVGLAPAPDWMLYAKGGYAGARIDTAGRVTPQQYPAEFDFSERKFHSGWTAGAGVERRLFGNVSVGLEYNYFNFGNVTHGGQVTRQDQISPGVFVSANPVGHDVKADMHTVMARINFGFDWSDPSAAYAQVPAKMPLKAPPVQAAINPFSAFVTSEVKYASWEGGRGSNTFAPERGSGYQIYSPTTIGINYVDPEWLKFETRFKGGYVYSNHTTPFQSARYEGPVDSQVSFNATFLNFESIRPLLGLAMNLPTGNPFLPGNQRFTRMDPDLVEVGSYGAGFNVNPTAGFIFGLNETTAISISGGYAFQGPFTREAINLGLTPANDQLNTFDLRRRIDPGDTFTANANVTTSFGESLILTASFAFIAESKVITDGNPSGRAGSRFTSNLTANYRIDDRWAITFNGSWNFSEKNQITGPLGGFITEPKNSNSHVVIGSIEPTYQATDRLRLGINYSVLYRDANFYNQFEDQFVPAKLKQSAGASLSYLVTPTSSITLRGAHAWIEQKDGAFLLTTLAPPPPGFAFQPPPLKYESWTVSVAGTIQF